MTMQRAVEVQAANRKRVLVIAPKLLPWSETFIKEQARTMRRWQPILVGDRLVEDGLPLDGHEIRLLTPREKGRFYRWSYVAYRLLSIAHPPSVRLLRSANASLVHAHFGTTAVDVWPLVAALGLPMLVTLHGFDINIYRRWWEEGQGGWLRRRYPRQLLDLAAQPNVHFIAVSKAIQRSAIAYGIPEDKLSVRHIGVDTARFHPGPVPLAQRNARILFAGRLVEKKGVEFLIRAFARVLENVPNAELVIVGDGPLRSGLENLAKSLDVPVEFLGAIPNALVREQTQQARIFCLPSITASNGDAEGLPTVVLEAQAGGLAVITSARGAVEEAVKDRETGICFKEKDSDGLATHLINLLTSPSHLASLSRLARESVTATFDINRCTRALEDVYARCASMHE